MDRSKVAREVLDGFGMYQSTETVQLALDVATKIIALFEEEKPECATCDTQLCSKCDIDQPSDLPRVENPYADGGKFYSVNESSVAFDYRKQYERVWNECYKSMIEAGWRPVLSEEEIYSMMCSIKSPAVYTTLDFNDSKDLQRLAHELHEAWLKGE